MGAFYNVYFMPGKEELYEKVKNFFLNNGKKYYDKAIMFLFKPGGKIIEFGLNFQEKSEDLINDLSSAMNIPCVNLSLADGELTSITVSSQGKIVFRVQDNEKSEYASKNFQKIEDYDTLSKIFPHIDITMFKNALTLGNENTYDKLVSIFEILHPEADDGWHLEEYYNGQYERLEAQK
jgi:hypothetical protein